MHQVAPQLICKVIAVQHGHRQQNDFLSSSPGALTLCTSAALSTAERTVTCQSRQHRCQPALQSGSNCRC